LLLLLLCASFVAAAADPTTPSPALYPDLKVAAAYATPEFTAMPSPAELPETGQAMVVTTEGVGGDAIFHS
jgi:hypothetical protein